MKPKNKTRRQTRPQAKVISGSGKSKKPESFFARHSRVISIVAVVAFGIIGTYYIIRSFAATPTVYNASQASVTIASWNTFVDNKTKLDTVIPTLMQKADIIALQEVHTTAQRNVITKNVICSKCAYDGVTYPNKNTKKAIDPRGGYPIVWKRDLFERVDKLHVVKTAPKVTVTKKIRFKARYAEWTILRDKRTGKQFVVINTHTYAKAEYHGHDAGYKKINQGYKNHMAKLKSLVEGLQKNLNIPIFIIGDFNVDYRYDTGSVAYYPKAVLAPLGFVSNWSAAKYLENDVTMGSAPSEDSVASISDEEIVNDTVQPNILGTLRVGEGGRIIDYVYAWQRSDVAFQGASISAGTYGSDHAPVFATYVIGN